MEADPRAFRGKYRKMAADPHAFYRGTACLFYADVTAGEDPFCDERSGRIWIHGDLHVENFGTYLNSDGRLVFDINDFDEAYLGRFTWDLQRFAASLALVGWQKALPEDDVRGLIGATSAPTWPRSTQYRDERRKTTSPCTSTTPKGRSTRRCSSRAAAAASRPAGRRPTVWRRGARAFREDRSVRRLGKRERARGRQGLRAATSTTIPEDKRFDRELFYDLHDVVGKSGFGIGSAGLPAYNLLVEGYSQALDNDVRAVDEAGQRAGGQPVRRHQRGRRATSTTRGTAPWCSQRALQVHTDPLLGHTAIDGVGYVVAEVSPYEVDLDWSGHHRARRDRRRSSSCWAGPPPRCTAPPTRTATRTSSTSRSRTRSRRASTAGAARSSRPG